MLFYRRRGAIVKVKEDRERKAIVLEERWKRFEGRGGVAEVGTNRGLDRHRCVGNVYLWL